VMAMDDFLEGLGQETALSIVDEHSEVSPYHDREQVEEKIEEARKLANLIDESRDAIRALPRTKDDARRRLAMARFAETFGMAAPSGMSLETYQAAMLIGRGLTHEEAADAVGLQLSELYQRMDGEFRRVCTFWYHRTFEEYFSHMIRIIDFLIESTTDPETLIKLVTRMESLADRAEDRERWLTEIHLREREIRAREQETDAYVQSVSQLSKLVPGETLEAIDVEFEIEEAQDG